MEKFNAHKKRKALVFLLLILSLIIGIAFIILKPSNNINSEVYTTNQQNNFSEDTINYTLEIPSEEIPTETNLHINSDEPKAISFPSIQSGGFIQKVAIDQWNEIAAPNNIHIAGWFVNSAKPGQGGVSIIKGYVDGKTSEGIFKRIYELEVDDVLEIELGNGSKINFRAVEIKEISKEDENVELNFKKVDIESQLNLITYFPSHVNRTLVIARRI